MDFLFQEDYQNLRQELRRRIENEPSNFNHLREQIKILLGEERRLNRRVANTVAFVASDGGMGHVAFDPFFIYVIQVVDSQRNIAYPPEILTANTPESEILERHFHKKGDAKTPLGRLMADLGVYSLSQLTYTFEAKQKSKNPFFWISDYRELIEWASLYEVIVNRDFGTDTLLIFDGLLRSFAFREEYFASLAELLKNRIQEIYRKTRRKIYIVGVAKKTRFLDRYRLAMFLEGILAKNYPAYVKIPPELEETAYKSLNYILRRDNAGEVSQIRNSMGRMFLVKFGSYETDPIWPVDIFYPQEEEAQKILEALLNDAIDGFPIPSYPLSLQRAHHYAIMTDLGYSILQDLIIEEITSLLNIPKSDVEKFCLQDFRIANKRYIFTPQNLY